jgi:hypothetical protein
LATEHLLLQTVILVICEMTRQAVGPGQGPIAENAGVDRIIAIGCQAQDGQHIIQAAIDGGIG